MEGARENAFRLMTGAYLRVQRDGKWLNLEVEYLTDEERQEKLSNDPRLVQWLNLVCATLVDAERLLDKVETRLD